jgi:S-adenosylmethionine/arginine decarboxylase-like enzyme
MSDLEALEAELTVCLRGLNETLHHMHEQYSQDIYRMTDASGHPIAAPVIAAKVDTLMALDAVRQRISDARLKGIVSRANRQVDEWRYRPEGLSAVALVMSGMKADDASAQAVHVSANLSGRQNADRAGD